GPCRACAEPARRRAHHDRGDRRARPTRDRATPSLESGTMAIAGDDRATSSAILGRRAALSWAALVLACALAAHGCGEHSARDGPVTLVFKHAKILGPSDPMPRLLNEFEALHPGVRVHSEAIPWNADEQHQFYAVNLESGSPGFDVLMLDLIWVPEFAQAGWLLDLSGAVSDSELAAHFPAAVRAANVNGRVWAIPWMMNVGLLYYRKDLLDKHGLRPPDSY